MLQRGLRLAPPVAALLALWLGGPTPVVVAQAPGWGTIKGRVVLDGKKPAGGDYVVNPKNGGVRWVIVWLADADGDTAKLPIHPALTQPAAKKVTVDTPALFFEPHIVCLREGQALEITNSGKVAVAPRVDSAPPNPSVGP